MKTDERSPLRAVFLILIFVFAFATPNSFAVDENSTRPNVLMIVVDDMNDWVSLLDANSPIKTPHLEELAARGTLFTQAYCASPACNPSRVATLTGLRPSSTGVYGNASDWRRAMPERKTIMQQFMASGYTVRGAGKIFHHQFNGAFHDNGSFHDFQPMRAQSYPAQKLNSAPEYGSRNTDWGQWPPRVEDTIDFQTAEYCIAELKKPSNGQPLFLACGIYKPHSPFFAPSSFHDSYQDIPFPVRKSDDWDDLPSGAKAIMSPTRWFWRGMQAAETKNPGSYHDFIRSYAACASFADAQIGRVIDALDHSDFRRDTIVVLWSDHGFHLGEKDHLEKFALWEKSNHIPLIIVAPNMTTGGRRCDQPVDLSVIYPTLLELCGLPADEHCDGKSVVPLLRNPDVTWDHPALMTYGQGNHAVRSERWRYIQYADGSEELYDHQTDPHEWTNLASQDRYHEIIAEHRKSLPKSSASPVPNLAKPKRK